MPDYLTQPRRCFISVISHGHGKMIIAEQCLKLLVDHRFTVVLKDNKPQRELQEHCVQNGIHYLVDRTMGFGANNNFVFTWCRQTLGMRDDDYFLVLNPDVFIAPDVLTALLSHVTQQHYAIAAINLFSDRALTIYDKGIRRFPTLISFATSFLLQKMDTLYDRDNMTEDNVVDWAAGSFLLFNAECYRRLGGFDTRYYMYCEDVDICWRARHELGIKLMYLPQFKALHLAQMRSRSLFSRHFIWHVTSALRFCIKRMLRR